MTPEPVRIAGGPRWSPGRWDAASPAGRARQVRTPALLLSSGPAQQRLHQAVTGWFDRYRRRAAASWRSRKVFPGR